METSVSPKKQQKSATKKAAVTKAPSAPKPQSPVVQQQEPQPEPVAPPSDYDRATGPVDGYIATGSASATKTGTPLIETPQTVNVVTADQMEAQGITSVSQALRYTPGVIAEYRPSSRYDSMFIRGFGGGGNNANYVSFWDGLRIPKGISYAIPTIDPYFLERVEVIKGPSAVLFGQISPGGFVNLVSKKPPNEAFGEIETVIGTDSHLQTNFDFGGPLNAQNTFSYRLTGLYRQSESHIDFSESERFAIAPEFAFRPSDNTTLTVQAYYQNDPEGGYYNGLPALGTLIPYGPGKIPSNFNPGEPTFDGFEREQFSLGYQFEHRFDEAFKVRQNVRYTHLESLFKSVSPAGYTSPTSSTMTRRATYSDESFDAITIDNQAEGKFSTGAVQHTVLAGLDYYYRDGDRLLANAVTAGVPTLNFNNPVYGATIPNLAPFMSSTNQTISQTGLYLQDQMKFDNFVFVLGGRYDWSDVETSNVAVASKDEAFSWRAGLLYNFDNGLAPYVSYSTSFEPTTSLGVGNTPLDPVDGEQYEVGVKFQPKGLNSFVSLALYDITQSNVLIALTAPNNGFFSQLGEVTSKGFEAEAKIELSENLNLMAAYAYTNAEISKDSNAALIGNTPASVPEHTASLWADYRFVDGPFAGLGIGAGVRYIGETYANNLNTFVQGSISVVPAKVDAFTLVDASIRYDLSYLSVPELKGWEVAVQATNLLDEDYISGCLGTAAANTQCWYGDRRVVLGKLKYKW